MNQEANIIHPSLVIINKNVSSQSHSQENLLSKTIQFNPSPVNKDNNNNHYPFAIPVIKNTKPIPLFCLDLNGEDYRHFLMNYEKCRELNSIYLQYSSYIRTQINQVNFF